MSSANGVEICINGVHYHIATGESPEYVHELAREVDGQLQTLFDRNPSITFNDGAVLCLINYADAYRRNKEGADHMRNQIADYLEDAAKARIELDEANRRVEMLEKDNQMLRQEIENLKRNGGRR